MANAIPVNKSTPDNEPKVSPEAAKQAEVAEVFEKMKADAIAAGAQQVFMTPAGHLRVDL